ncbi:MAG: hypothetical protein KGJ48_06350 [Nitrospirota bacterium]|nr:hypothetical protein [Nitrospirota bacterium]MDE3219692.1 hypothetical protein [Nitrospirota bacterium]
MKIEETGMEDREEGNGSKRGNGPLGDTNGKRINEDARSSQEWFEEADRLEIKAGGALAAPRALANSLNDERACLYELAKRALHQSFIQTNGAQATGTWGEPYDAYSSNVEANLLDGVPFADLRKAFDDGKGQELHGDAQQPPKMAAVYSSSALVVNTFGPWHQGPSNLVVNGHRGFKTMSFEAQVPHGLKGTPPHLDLRLDAEDRVLAIESKCLEYLRPKKAVFAPAYDTIVDHRARSPWFRHIAALRENSDHYQYLDAAQLIKHYLGLSHSEPTKSLRLLYLYWEPRNWQDFEPFRQHRAEILEFSDVVVGDPVRFEALSYNELWAQWERLKRPAWLPSHLQRLKARYSVEL